MAKKLKKLKNKKRKIKESQVISVIQQKGGAGKTTLAVHLAFVLQELYPRYTVAIADADPQQSAFNWIDRNEDLENSIVAYQVASDGSGKGLRKELNAIDADLLIVDLPPAIESVSLRAALYANLMLVPVGASVLDVEAAKAAVEVCEEALSIDSSKSFLIVPTKVRSSTSAGRELRKELEELGPVSGPTIGLRVAYSDAAALGKGIGSYAPGSAAHNEILELAKEVISLLNAD